MRKNINKLSDRMNVTVFRGKPWERVRKREEREKELKEREREKELKEREREKELKRVRKKDTHIVTHLSVFIYVLSFSTKLFLSIISLVCLLSLPLPFSLFLFLCVCKKGEWERKWMICDTIVTCRILNCERML